MELKKTVNDKFLTLFGKPGVVYASAGRINLIGEHTDYNGGFVFPGAIDKVITYTTTSANLMIREIGISLFLACVGLEAGEQDKNSENAAVGYATVYPLSMFLRVLAAQLMILFFL